MEVRRPEGSRVLEPGACSAVLSVCPAELGSSDLQGLGGQQLSVERSSTPAGPTGFCGLPPPPGPGLAACSAGREACPARKDVFSASAHSGVRGAQVEEGKFGQGVTR